MDEETQELINAVGRDGKLVEPINYEEWIDGKASILQDCDPHTDLMLFPSDDIEVTSYPRDYRSLDDPVPCSAREFNEENPHVFDSVSLLTKDWCIVNRRYEKSLTTGTFENRQSSLGNHPYEIDIMKAEVNLEEATSLMKNENNRSSFASDNDLLDETEGDRIILQYLKAYTLPKIKETDDSNKRERQKQRPATLFSLYSSPQNYHLDERIESRKKPIIPPDHERPYRIQITFHKLELLQCIEPLYLSVALYDARLKKKVSETIHIDLNSDDMLKMATPQLTYQTITRGTKVIFCITDPTSDVYVVIRVEKTLQKDELPNSFDAYAKEVKTQDKKTTDKQAQVAADFCSRLGAYRMPFLWTGFNLERGLTGRDGMFVLNSATPGSEVLVNDISSSDASMETSGDSLSVSSFNTRYHSSTLDKKLSRYGSTGASGSVERMDINEMRVNLGNFTPKKGSILRLFKQETEHLSDEDICKYLFEMNNKKNPTLKRFKFVNAELCLEIQTASYQEQSILTPSLKKVAPYVENKNASKNERQYYPAREVEEFPGREVYLPYHEYRNFLYVYPLNLNFSNRTGSCRNILLKVQLLEAEGETGVLEAIYGKSSSSGLSKEALTCVQYHNKTPVFYEEVKIELPPYLTKNHHLLFKFYHIVCQMPKTAEKQRADKEQLIGITWLPLRQTLETGDDKKVKEKDDSVLALALGEHKLPVCTDIPKGIYSVISPKQIRLPTLQWVDEYRDLFHVRVASVSTIHMQEEILNNFTLCYYTYTRGDTSTVAEAELKRSIERLKNLTKKEPLMRHLYLILDRLFALLVRNKHTQKGGPLSEIVFKAISDIVRDVHELHKKRDKLYSRNGILASYVAYLFDTPGLSEDWKSQQRSASLSRGTSDSDDNTDTSTPRGSPAKGVGGVLHERCKSLSASTQTTGITGESSKETIRGRSGSLLKRFVRHVHEQLVSQWTVSSVRVQSYEHAWFFFEIVVKSMAQHLSRSGFNGKSRRGWFPKDYKEDLVRLTRLISREIIVKMTTDSAYVHFINKSLAYFFQDILSLMDRGFVFELIRTYWETVKIQNRETKVLSGGNEVAPSEEGVLELKLNFLHVICQHEHYVPLNLPYPHSLFQERNPVKSSGTFKLKLKSTKTALSLSSLNKTYCQRHFLVGLLLSLESYILTSSTSATLQRAVILLTRDVLFAHDNDGSLADTARRSRVASLYLPFVTIVLDVREKLWDFTKPGRDGASTQDDTIIQSPFSSMGRGTGKKMGQIPTRSTRTLLLCVLSILKNCDDDLLKKWWSTMKPNRIINLISVIRLCVECFEYQPKNDAVSVKAHDKAESMKVQLEAMYERGAARRHIKQNCAVDNTRSWKSALHHTKAKSNEMDGTDSGTADLEEAPERLVCAETSIIILDTLELLVESGTKTEIDSAILSLPVVSKIIGVLLLMMSSNQSIPVLQMVFATQRSIITKFPHIIFEEETDLCSKLCYQLLKHCASFVAEIREEAVASIYLLMRQNYESSGSFSKVKIQLTIALSRLRGSANEQKFNDVYLNKSLVTLRNYAERETPDLCSTRFPEQVKEVAQNLFMIMRDTVRMKEVNVNAGDPATKIDLMYRIAKGYQNSPPLRVTWLKNMASEHELWDQKCEAAMCYIHAAALMSEYLSMVDYQHYLPKGCSAFQGISPNVLQECAIMDDVLKPDEDGICMGEDYEFSGQRILELLGKAVKLLHECHIYEGVEEVSRLMSSMYKYKRDSKKMAEIHKSMTNAYNEILRIGKNRREMGCYFRVSFYGERFNELDRQTMIYKEKPFTKLPEISHRLQKLYGEQFGSDFEFISDSKRIELDLLDPYRAYVQVTYVEPYFEPWEMKYRKTPFELTYNVDRFCYFTPFTRSGTAHGGVAEQFKRRTVLRTECTFPYVKSRLNVVGIEETVMAPIEVATEDMRMKNEQFETILASGKTDLKMLQMLIQGAIGTTVNQGPLEIIMQFFGETAKSPDVMDERYLRYRNRLRYQCKLFLANIKRGLDENRNLIGTFQEDYQREMEYNLAKFRETVARYIFNVDAQKQIKDSSLLYKNFGDGDHSVGRVLSYDCTDAI